jgi:hypothetical protein
VLFAGQGAAVVGDRVEAEVVHEVVQAEGDLRGPGEVVRVDGGVEGEQLPGQAPPVGDLGVGELIDADPQVVELEHLHVGAEGGGHAGEVSRDVEHPWVQVTHEPVPAVRNVARTFAAWTHEPIRAQALSWRRWPETDRKAMPARRNTLATSGTARGRRATRRCRRRPGPWPRSAAGRSPGPACSTSGRWAAPSRT